MKSPEEIYNDTFGGNSQPTAKKSAEDIYAETFGQQQQQVQEPTKDAQYYKTQAQRYQEDAKISLPDKLIASFATDPITAAEYLHEKYPDQKLVIENGEMFLDDRKVNLSGAVREALPFIGQVAGSVAASPTVLGSAAAGVGGAVAGRGAQIAIGKMLGLDYDQEEIISDIATTAAGATIGEALGLGVVGVAKTPLGAFAKKRAKDVAEIIKKGIKKAVPLGEQTKDGLVKMIFRLDKNMVNEMKKTSYETIGKNGQKTVYKGVDAVLESPAWADPTLLNSKANELVFGSKRMPTSAGIKSTADGVDMAVKDVINNAKQLGAGGEELLKRFGGLPDDVAKTVMQYSDEALTSPKYVKGTWAQPAAENIATKLSQKAENIRSQMSGRIDKVLRGESGHVVDIGDEVANFMNTKQNLSILNAAKGMDEFGNPLDPTRVPFVKGQEKLQDIENIFMQSVKSDKMADKAANMRAYYKKAISEAQKNGDTATVNMLNQKLIADNEALKSGASDFAQVKFMRKGELFKAWKQVDAVVDAANKDASIDSTVLATINDFAKNFRGKAQKAFNVDDLAAEFTKLRRNSGDIIRELSVAKDFGGKVSSWAEKDAIAGLSNMLKTYSDNPMNKELLGRVLGELGDDGARLAQQVRLADASQNLAKLNTADMRARLFNYLNEPKNVLTEGLPRTERSILADIDNMMSPKNKFMNDAKLYHLARTIQDRPAENLLRFNTLAGALGGTVGFGIGGVPGAIMGFTGASALGTPTVFAGALKALSKASAAKKALLAANRASKLSGKKIKLPEGTKKAVSATAKATAARIAASRMKKKD